MTRVLRTHRRLTRQAIRKHRADFINARPTMYSRMSAARVWEGLHKEHGDAVLGITNFAPVWKRGLLP